MDPDNHMQQVRKSLKEWEEKASKLREECEEDLKLNLQLHRSDADIKKRQEKEQIDRYIKSQRKILDSSSTIEQNDISMAMKLSLAFDEKMKQERDVLNQALSKALEENEANIQKERGKVDSMIKQAWEQMDKVMENERSQLQSLIQSLIEEEEVRATVEEVPSNNNNEEVEDGIYIPRSSLWVLLDNECDLVYDVVMKFKVHRVKELYLDLKKYSREERLSQFTITKPTTTVKFYKMLGALRPFGYIGEAELYYLNPAPGSQPSTGLIKIHGQDEVNELVLAHAEQRTKICHLYLVNASEEVLNDDMWYYDDDDTSHAMKKRAVHNQENSSHDI